MRVKSNYVIFWFCTSYIFSNKWECKSKTDRDANAFLRLLLLVLSTTRVQNNLLRKKNGWIEHACYTFQQYWTNKWFLAMHEHVAGALFLRILIGSSHCSRPSRLVSVTTLVLVLWHSIENCFWFEVAWQTNLCKKWSKLLHLTYDK